MYAAFGLSRSISIFDTLQHGSARHQLSLGAIFCKYGGMQAIAATEDYIAPGSSQTNTMSAVGRMSYTELKAARQRAAPNDSRRAPGIGLNALRHTQTTWPQVQAGWSAHRRHWDSPGCEVDACPADACSSCTRVTDLDDASTIWTWR